MKGCPVMMTRLVIATVLSIRKNTLKAMPIRKVIRTVSTIPVSYTHLIVINSLRIAEVPMLPHMDRPADRKAGCKHRCTDAAMNYLKAEVMEMCHSEGLYQIDLLNGSKERITEREYWAQKKGQAALDKANAPMIADGITPRQTKFETDKAKLRRTIREALAAASGFDEFAALLLRHGAVSYTHLLPGQGRWAIYGIGLEDEILKKIYYKNACKDVYKRQAL